MGVDDGAGAVARVDAEVQVELGGRCERPVDELAGAVDDRNVAGCELVQDRPGRRDRDEIVFRGETDVSGGGDDEPVIGQPTTRAHDSEALGLEPHATLKTNFAGLWSVFPDGSVDEILNLCLPESRCLSFTGEV